MYDIVVIHCSQNKIEKGCILIICGQICDLTNCCTDVMLIWLGISLPHSHPLFYVTVVFCSISLKNTDKAKLLERSLVVWFRAIVPSSLQFHILTSDLDRGENAHHICKWREAERAGKYTASICYRSWEVGEMCLI